MLKFFPWRKAVILLCLSLFAAACSRSAPPPALPYLSDDAVILAFGDSLTYGTGARREQAYPAILSGLIGRTVVVEANPGDKTSDGLAKFDEALDEHRPDLLILCLGGNDFLRKVPLPVTRNNMVSMIERARDQGIPVVLLAVPSPALFGLEAHPLYEELATTYQLPLENDILSEVFGNKAAKSDPLHPNAQGYAQVAEALAALLRASGAL